ETHLPRSVHGTGEHIVAVGGNDREGTSAMSVKKQTRASENADPHELNNPVPRVLLGVILALVVWGVYYIFSANPNSVAGLGDRRDPATLVAAAPSENGAIDGKQLFTTACQSCHQASGQGLTGVFPPLAGAEWVTG